MIELDLEGLLRSAAGFDFEDISTCRDATEKREESLLAMNELRILEILHLSNQTIGK